MNRQLKKAPEKLTGIEEGWTISEQSLKYTSSGTNLVARLERVDIPTNIHIHHYTPLSVAWMLTYRRKIHRKVFN